MHLGSDQGATSRFEIGADGYFVGPQIRIWPTENVVRIQGAGEFRMPTSVLPTALSEGGSQRIQWTSAPHCKWNGEMIFDGKMAVLTEGVDINAALKNNDEPWSIHMTGDRLEVVMLDDIKVRQVESIKAASIQQVTLLQSAEHPVIVRAERVAGDGILEARHVLHAPKLTLLPSGGGKLVGLGPGWYRSWAKPNSDGPLSFDDAKPTAAQDRKLTGTHMIYHQVMQGDLTNKSLEFLGGVRVGVRPVDDWQQVFDAQQMDAISEGDSTLDCESLHIATSPGFESTPAIAGLKTPWEMQAVGGVVFRHRNAKGLLEGTAARAVYSSGKELFTIEGASNRGATMQHTKPSGQVGVKLAVREASINPKTFELENTTFLSFGGTVPEPKAPEQNSQAKNPQPQLTPTRSSARGYRQR